MKKSILTDIISALFILLFVYTAASKLFDLNQFKMQMYNQTVPHAVAAALIWLIPGSEIVTVLLLLFQRTKVCGLYLSAILMTVFTAYIVLVLFNYFGRIPCSCGGVLQVLSWHWHLLLNIFFLLLSLIAIYVTNRERRSQGTL